MKEKIDDTNLTLSGRFLDEILSKNLSFIDFGNYIGESNKSYYLNLKKSENFSWDILEKEAIESHEQQKILEADDTKSFEVFIDDYFKY